MVSGILHRRKRYATGEIVFDKVILQELSVMDRISSPQCTRRISQTTSLQ